MKKLIFLVALFFFPFSLIQGDQDTPGHKNYEAPEDITIEDLLKELEGNWMGHGAGEEVRFRDPNGLLILTVKHTTEFFFHVNEKGEIEGEGTIEYDLEQNTSGLDDLVATVHGLMGLMPTPGAPGSGAMSKTADNMGKQTTNVPGVTRMQYNAPHLKYGKELRHFKFEGRIQDGSMYIDVVLNFTLANGTPNNTLIAEYEVNKVKEESTFPCWSPFLKEPGILRRGPGGIWIVDFQEQGTHRNEIRVWEEYGYVWMTRKMN